MKKHLSLEVEFHSTVKFTTLEQRKLKSWLKLASLVVNQLMQEGIIPVKNKKLAVLKVSLLLCGDGRIKKLNREFRGKEKVTDVLSFPDHENLRKGFDSYSAPEIFLGDLAISSPQTKRQARKYSIDFWDEFIHLFFHGLLHLLGYDHEISKKEEKLMQEWEDRSLELFTKYKKKKGEP